jgi:transcription termination/antitermination protein NusG
VQVMDKKWYVVRTFSGHENKVKNLLETELEDNDSLRGKIEEILVPMEKVFEVKDGKKKSKTKNFFPGYILVQADLDNQVKEFILNTQSVMGFLGTKNNPNPLQPEEVKRIVGRITQDENSERMETIFRSGDLVKIIDGPFNNFSGTIQEVNEEKMKIKVMVSIFGRKTPVEIDFVQAELEK